MSIGSALPAAPATPTKKSGVRQEVEQVIIRFAGDSGDGMQLTGEQFTQSSAIAGSDVSTLPDFPAEIRAPAGSLFGVSGFQLNFSSRDIHTPGDQLDVLVAMNPAALKTNLKDLREEGLLILNKDAFNERNLEKADYVSNPLEDGSLSRYRVQAVPLSTLCTNALEPFQMPKKDKERSKNVFALGLLFWLYDRPMEPTVRWFEKKFARNPDVANANMTALKAGFAFGETSEMFPVQYRVKRAALAPGLYRKVMGNEATVLGLVAVSHLAGRPLFLGSYPITPASDILHGLSMYKQFGVRTFQAEDEIAAIGSAIGAAFGGALATTSTSGPGIALKSEAMNLAVMTELPLVVINVQRGGPSTGLPTKTEQSDLLQVIFGRNGESPIPVIAACSPSDCFHTIIEAFRIAIQYMTPVVMLSDGYLANGSEPWLVPDVSKLAKFETVKIPTKEDFQPYLRNEKTLARPWVVPGTPGYEHRIGGLEKEDVTGEVCYDPANHEKMVRLRAEKVERVQDVIPPTQILGDAKGDLLVVGWGGTYGAIRTAVDEVRLDGKAVSAIHLRHLNPFPRDLEGILKNFKRVLVPELNLGQLRWLLRARYLVDAEGLNKVQGQPLTIKEVKDKIYELLRK